MKEKKKIAYILKMFPRFAETFILNEILELERQGVSLHLISLKHPNEDYRQGNVSKVKSKVSYVPEPIKLTPFLFLKNLRSMLPILKANFHLYRKDPARYKNALAVLRNSADNKTRKQFLAAGYIANQLLDADIDHIHAHFANAPASVARFVHLLTGIPYSFTAHAKDIYLSDKKDLRAKIHQAEFVVTCTHTNRNYMHEVSRNGTPIHTVYHGLDADIFLNGKTNGRNDGLPVVRPNEQPLILAVGRLVEKKGFDCLIEACNFLRYGGVDFRCQIVGQGPLELSLENQIERFELSELVEIVPFVPQAELVSKYRQAAVFVLPCRITANGDRDGIANVLLEAMAQGLPVVSTNVSGISEVVTSEKSGFLVPPQNPRALAETLETIISQPELFQSVGVEARKVIEQRFDLTANIARMRQLFEVN